jgi:hypothetical protein
MQEIRLGAARLGATAVTFKRGRLELAGLKIDVPGRAALEGMGLKFVYHPSRRILVIWPGEAGGLSIVKRTLDGIIDSLLTSTTQM